jgi:hypothetical protein
MSIRGDLPHIVLILADNLGWGELGCYGGGVLRGAPTPRIDRLASEGLRLTNFNVESDCVPTRSALMTGRHPIRTGALQSPAGLPQGIIPGRSLAQPTARLCDRDLWQVAPQDREGRYPRTADSTRYASRAPPTKDVHEHPRLRPSVVPAHDGRRKGDSAQRAVTTSTCGGVLIPILSRAQRNSCGGR